MKGWIYILSNESVPDWLAIGCSDTDPEALVHQYGNLGIKLPYPFELEYTLRTPYAHSLLQKIHHELEEKCVNPEHNVDWFECDLLRAIRTTRKIAGHSATGEAFYGHARQMVQQAQQKKQAEHHANVELSNQHLTQNQDVNIKQIRTVPEPQHGRRPSPIAPVASKAEMFVHAALTEPDSDAIPAKEDRPENPKLIAFLIVVWVILLIILVFLIAYVFGYI